ncbi:translin [Atheta coriaria]|uniref:translin n=1 Tax=Dalotia coriaria TaxID=877792 RepID=UPI0031F44317
MADTVVNDIFSSYQKYLDNEQETREQIRTVVKEIETHAREMITILQVIHQENCFEEIPQACLKTRQVFEKVRPEYVKLSALVVSGQYYRYNDHWRFVTQRLCFIAALVVYLEVGILISKETCAEIIGVKLDHKEGFHLELEDYLMGILQLSSELARFAVNAVTSGDYNRPMEISKFVSNINAGFRLLNLKNDSLRKRFDVLKYDVKKIEEIVYDLSIRGLKPGAQQSTD